MEEQVEKTSGWILKVIFIVISWLLLEVIASWIHVKIMGKYNGCPFASGQKKEA